MGRGERFHRPPSRTVGGLFLCAALAVAATTPPAIARTAPAGRLVVIVLENKTYSHVTGSAATPYIHSLMSAGTQFTNYWAVASGSPRD
jgi:hypothetical protein